MKKFLLILLSVVLLVPLISPLTASADGKVDLFNDWENEGGEFFNTDGTYRIMDNPDFSEEEADKVFAAAPIMDQYITMESGTLEINPTAKTKVAPEIYEQYEKGVNTLNEGVRDNVLYLDNVSKTPQLVTPLDQIGDSTNAVIDDFSRKYWWGLKWYMNSRESRYYRDLFNDRSFTWGFVSALIGMIPGSQPAFFAGMLMSAGNWYLYRELRDNRSYRGSVLVFKWAPPKIYAYRR